MFFDRNQMEEKKLKWCITYTVEMSYVRSTGELLTSVLKKKNNRNSGNYEMAAY